MRWQVLWSPVAEQEIVAIWTADDPDQSAKVAAFEIDADLRLDPMTVGESRPNGERIHFVKPLGVYFTLNIRMQEVLVTHVWRFDN